MKLCYATAPILALVISISTVNVGAESDVKTPGSGETSDTSPALTASSPALEDQPMVVAPTEPTAEPVASEKTVQQILEVIQRVERKYDETTQAIEQASEEILEAFRAQPASLEDDAANPFSISNALRTRGISVRSVVTSVAKGTDKASGISCRDGLLQIRGPMSLDQVRQFLDELDNTRRLGWPVSSVTYVIRQDAARAYRYVAGHLHVEVPSGQAPPTPPKEAEKPPAPAPK
jgi:hypothetical protein